MLRIPILAFLAISAALGSALTPQIDDTINFGPYKFVEFSSGRGRTRSRLNLDKIFTGFNLSFSYLPSDSQSYTPVPKNLTADDTFDLPPQDFIIASMLGNFTQSSHEDIAILYSDKINILRIEEDDNITSFNQSFSEDSDISCNDFIYPIANIIILSCFRNSTNETLFGYFDLTGNSVLYYPAPNQANTDFKNIQLDEFFEDTSSNYFWRYYTSANWFVEKWEVSNGGVKLLQTVHQSQIDVNIPVLNELQGHSDNVIVLSNLTNVMILVRILPNDTRILDQHFFGTGSNLTKVTIFQRDFQMYLIAQCNKTLLKTFNVDHYVFEEATQLFSTGLSDEIYDFDLLEFHTIAIYSANSSVNKAFASIANFYTKSNGNVIFKDLEPVVSEKVFVFASRFIHRSYLKFFVLKRGGVDIMIYTRPTVMLSPTNLNQMLNMFPITVTSTCLDQSISKNYSLPIYYYNESYFKVDTTNLISNESFVTMLYPNSKRIYLDELGLKVPFPQIVSHNITNCTLNDYRLIETFDLLATPEGIVAKDPTNMYWAFDMKPSALVYRCTDLPKNCLYTGKIQWPMLHKHVEIFMEAYPLIVFSYAGAKTLKLSTFTIAQINTAPNFTITERTLAKYGKNDIYCQALKLNKVQGKNYLLCFGIKNSTFESSLVIYYLDDMLNSAANWMRNVSLPLPVIDAYYDQSSFGVQMEVYQDLLILFLEKNFTFVCFNISNLNYSNPSPDQVKFIDSHDAFQHLVRKSEESRVFLNTQDGILIIAIAKFGIFEEWLIDTKSKSRPVMKLYAQTLTYGDLLFDETLTESKLCQPVAYSRDTNTLYMLASRGYDNGVYVYNLKYMGNNYPYSARLPRGMFSTVALTNQLFGVSAVSIDSYSDYLIHWSEKNIVYEYYSEPHFLINFANNYSQSKQINEFKFALEVSSIDNYVALDFNLSIYKLESTIAALCGAGEICNNITLGDTSVSWDIRPEEYFNGDVLDVSIWPEKPCDTTNHSIRFEGRIGEGPPAKLTDSVISDLRILAASVSSTQAYLLTTTALLIAKTTDIYKRGNFSIKAMNFSESITQNASHFIVNETSGWMQFFDKDTQSINTYSLSNQQLSEKISASYNQSKFYQVDFLNETHSVLVMQCKTSNISCENETFVSLWDLKQNIILDHLSFANLSSVLGVEVNNQTEIIAKMYQRTEYSGPVLLLTLTNRVKKNYLFAFCGSKDRDRHMVLNCTKYDLLELITDYNISRYGIEWFSLQIISTIDSNLTHFNWEILLGNRVYNCYVLNLAINKRDYTPSLSVLFALNNYIPNSENTRVTWSTYYIAVERQGVQTYNNLSKGNPYILYYPRDPETFFSVGVNYKLKNALGIRTLEDKELDELTALDRYEDAILILPTNFTNGYTIRTKIFEDYMWIEFENPSSLESHNLILSAQSFWSYNSVKIGINVVPKETKKSISIVPIAIALALLLLAGIAAVLYGRYRKRLEERRKKLLEEEDEEIDKEEHMDQEDFAKQDLTRSLLLKESKVSTLSATQL